MKTTILSVICLFALCSGQNPSIPVPGSGEWWLGRHNSFVSNTAANPAIPIIFYGDSFKIDKMNHGIAGDQTQHLLWRILNGEVTGLSPRLVVLKIGTNNLASAQVSDIANGILTIIRTLRTQLPNTKVLLLSMLPRNGVANFDNTAAINSIIETYPDGQNVFYLDMFNDFVGDVWGTVNETFFWDGLHLSEAGYQRWADLMNPLFNQLIQ